MGQVRGGGGKMEGLCGTGEGKGGEDGGAVWGR